MFATKLIVILFHYSTYIQVMKNPLVFLYRTFFYSIYMYVVVQFYPWFNFDSSLFFSMLTYDNEYRIKEYQN